MECLSLNVLSITHCLFFGIEILKKTQNEVKMNLQKYKNPIRKFSGKTIMDESENKTPECQMIQ